MSATADVLAIVMFVFFAVGVAVGIVIVIAFSAQRADKADRQHRRPAPPAADPGYYPDDDPDDEPPWWQSRGDDLRLDPPRLCAGGEGGVAESRGVEVCHQAVLSSACER
jgi:hypothetical protein